MTEHVEEPTAPEVDADDTLPEGDKTANGSEPDNELELLTAKNAELTAAVTANGVAIAERDAEIQRLKAAMFDMKNSAGSEDESIERDPAFDDDSNIDDLFNSEDN